MNKKIKISCLVALAALQGCATVSNVPDSKAGVDQAIAELGTPKGDDDILYFMEKGELLRRKGDLDSSKVELLKADEVVRKWEEKAKSGLDTVKQTGAALLVNDGARDYDARDYEKVLVSVRLATLHLEQGKWDDARVEITKMHEREDVISQVREKEIEAAKAEAEKKGLKTTSFKEIKGYPVETLDNPKVNALQNAYESAYANYLAGFVYEALGEGSLAAAGYRRAIEMRPDQPALTSALENLDARIGGGGPGVGKVDTLFLIEQGKAPQLQSQQLPIILPIPSSNGIDLIATPISWPVVGPLPADPPAESIKINASMDLPVSDMTNLDLMIRKSISNEMPGIITRSSIRAITRGAAQKAIDDNSNQMGGLGAVFSLVAKVGSLALEQADIRSWRNVPGDYALARAVLPAGKTSVELSGVGGAKVSKEVDLNGRYAVVVISRSGPETSIYASNYGQALVAEAPAPKVEAPAPEASKGKAKHKPKHRTKKTTPTKQTASTQTGS